MQHIRALSRKAHYDLTSEHTSPQSNGSLGLSQSFMFVEFALRRRGSKENETDTINWLQSAVAPGATLTPTATCTSTPSSLYDCDTAGTRVHQRPPQSVNAFKPRPLGPGRASLLARQTLVSASLIYHLNLFSRENEFISFSCPHRARKQSARWTDYTAVGSTHGYTANITRRTKFSLSWWRCLRVGRG